MAILHPASQNIICTSPTSKLQRKILCGKVTREGCIAFPLGPRPAPQRSFALASQAKFHTCSEKKSLQPRSRLCEAPSQLLAEIGYGRSRRCLLLSCLQLLSPSLTPQVTQPKKLLSSWRSEGDFPTSTESRISAALQCVLLQCSPSKPHHRERVPAPLTSPQRIQPCLALGKGSLWIEATGLAQSSGEVLIHHWTNVSLEVSEQDTARVQVLHLGRLVFLILLLLAGKGHFQRLLHLVVHS